MSRFAKLVARFALAVAAAASFEASGNAQCLSCAQNLSLPLVYTASVYPVSEGGGASTFVARFSNISGDYDITNGVFYGAWCADDPDFSSPARPSGGLLSTYALNLSLANSGKPWGKVNWVLNNRSGASARDVQQAIWLLLTGRVQKRTTATATALALAGQAQSAFVPGDGQVVAVILPGSISKQIQSMIIEAPVHTGRIGDLVWEDTNGNGIQEPGEAGVNGVVVRLKDSSGAVLATQTTGVQPGSPVGSYLFGNLPAGNYTVDYDASTIPAGLEPTLTLAGDVTKDSDTNPSTLHLDRRQSDLTVDFGLRPACNASVGNFVWRDLNGNGIQDAAEPGIDGLTVRLLTLGGLEVKTTTTTQNGFYQFTSVCPGSYSVSAGAPPSGYAASPASAPGSTPANDSDGVSGLYGVSAQVTVQAGSAVDSIDFGFVPPCNGSIGNLVWWDQNRNGLQDAGEPAIGGVKLRLLKGGADTGILVRSSGDGRYSFSGLCAGSYTVVIDSNPSGYSPTGTNRGDAAVDSNGVSAGSGVKADVTLADNLSSDDSIDFGFLGACEGTLGDLVWNDANRNGIQDAGEAGIQGVYLNLRNPLNNNIVASTSTDNNGKYSFGALCTGSYVVEAAPPAGYAASPAGQAGAASDSNSNPSAIQLATDVAEDDTIDFGFYPGAIGDIVWNDANRNGKQDDGPSGLAGFTVTLKDVGGVDLRTTTTGADGSYGFTAVAAGSYIVCVTPAAGWMPTFDLDGLATPNCATVALASGQNRTDADFGFATVNTGGPFTTYTQGGWGAKPAGNNPGKILQDNWTRVFGEGSFSVGGDKYNLTFTSSAAVEAFLPQGGQAGVLKASATNPTRSAAGVFAGQAVALSLSVAMSDAGVTRSNLAGLKLASGKLAGQTVAAVLQMCNTALNGGALPDGVTLSDLNSIVDSINNNFDNGTVDKGYLR
jgi:hypothetical protein